MENIKLDSNVTEIPEIPEIPEELVDNGEYALSDISSTEIRLEKVLKEVNYSPEVQMNPEAKKELLERLKEKLPELKEQNVSIKVDSAESVNQSNNFGLDFKTILTLMRKVVFNYSTKNQNDDDEIRKQQMFKDTMKVAAVCGCGKCYCKLQIHNYDNVIYTKPVDIGDIDSSKSIEERKKGENTLHNFFNFLKSNKLYASIIIEVNDIRSVELLMDMITETLDFIRYINSFVCTNIDNISKIQKIISECSNDLMMAGNTNMWIYLYNISYYWKLTYDMYPYFEESLESSLKKLDCEEKYYDVNNNMYSPGVNCGLYVEYNNKFSKISENEQINTIQTMKKDIETACKKESFIALWKDSSNDSENDMDFDNVENFSKFKHLFMNFDFVNTEV